MRELLRYVVSRSPKHFWDLAGNDVCLLAGSGRSGTTWLQEIIDYRRDHRVIFEPFWGRQVSLCVDFAGRQYLRPTNPDRGFTRPALRILRGDLRNTWTDQFSRWGKIYRKRLIKTIRANLLLKWLHRLVPAMPIVLMMRHPLAVVESQIRKGWEYEPANLFRSDELVVDYLAPFAALPGECRDAWDRNLLFWCIENYVPLRQFDAGEVHIVFFERLLNEPERELRRLFAHLGRKYEANALERIRSPSPLADPAGALSAVDPASFWRASISRERLKRAREILSPFGLDRIYGEDPMPDPSGAAALLADDAATETRNHPKPPAPAGREGRFRS